MIEKFLRAKHWQVFLLLIGVPLVTQITFFILMTLSIGVSENPDPSSMFQFIVWIPLLTLVSLVTYYLWFWSVVLGLQSRVPKGVKLKVKRFKIFFFFPIAYIILLTIVLSLLFSSGEPSPLILVIILPLHLFSMFCMFYILYFVAKTIKTVELQKEVEFSEFIVEFLLLWFFFIGIWIIQPKINEIIQNEIK